MVFHGEAKDVTKWKFSQLLSKIRIAENFLWLFAFYLLLFVFEISTRVLILEQNIGLILFGLLSITTICLPICYYWILYRRGKCLINSKAASTSRDIKSMIKARRFKELEIVLIFQRSKKTLFDLNLTKSEYYNMFRKIRYPIETLRLGIELHKMEIDDIVKIEYEHNEKLNIFYNIFHALIHNPFIELNNSMLIEDNVACLDKILDYDNGKYYSKLFVLNHQKDMSLSHYACQKCICAKFIEYIVLKQGINDFTKLKCKDQFSKTSDEEITPLQTLRQRKRKVIPQSFIDGLLETNSQFVE